MQTEVAASHLFFCLLHGRKVGDHFSKECTCMVAVVAAEVADINVEGYGGDFRPSMNGEVGFSQNNRARDPRRGPVRTVEWVEQAADDRQAMPRAGFDAENLQCLRIEQMLWRATAVMQVSDQVQAVHASILGRST